MQIISASKDEMIERFGKPYFGYTHVYPLGGAVCYIRVDLPSHVYASVLAHEKQHATDRAFLDGRVWHWELRAWRAGFRADWRGFCQGIWMSVTDTERIRLYWQRIIKKF